MDTGKFDAVARLFGNGMTRREALRGLVAGAVAVTAGGAVHAGQAASPKLRRRRKHRKQRRQRTPQDWCGRHGDGCGALDADTGEFTPPYCCHGYECVYSTSNGSSSWTCQARP
jgi:hypothetical protein